MLAGRRRRYTFQHRAHGTNRAAATKRRAAATERNTRVAALFSSAWFASAGAASFFPYEVSVPMHCRDEASLRRFSHRGVFSYYALALPSIKGGTFFNSALRPPHAYVSSPHSLGIATLPAAILHLSAHLSYTTTTTPLHIPYTSPDTALILHRS